MLQSTMKLRSTERFLDALEMEIARESFSELNLSMESESGCPRIIWNWAQFVFDFSRQEGCIQSGGISTSVDFLLRL